MSVLQASGSFAIKSPKRDKICIATPAYKSLYTGAYVVSLFGLIEEARKNGIGLAFSQVDFADIVDARNYLVSRFYFDHPTCSHLLFLDNDMGYEASLIMEMLAQDAGLVGVISPKRSVDLQQLHAASGSPFKVAYAKACQFIGKAGLGKEKKPFISAKALGAGILLIKRETITTMIKMCPDISRPDKARPPIFKHLGGYITPFNKVSVDGQELSEDYSFCHRWTEQCGGAILASTSSPIRHVGELTVETKFSDTWEP